MTNEALLRLVYCAVIAVVIALPFVPKFRSTMDKRAEFMKQPAYSPDMPVFYLPLFALTLAVLSLFLGGIETIMHTMISMGFPATVHICLYFLLLLPLLPWLRRHFTAQACAGLWMIPNCLYFVMRGFTQLPQPRWVVTVPGLRAEVIFYLWLAMDKCAQDLELSCDEAVLQNKDDAVRQQYAHLLLDTAATGRGFTTCLSTSAEAMRHRLKSVVEPVRRHSGALLIFFVCFVLCASCGHVALAYGGKSGEDVLFAGGAEACTLRDSISLSKDGGGTYNSVPKGADPAPLFDCLADLQLCRMTGIYTFDEREKGVSFWLRTPEGLRHIYLHDSFAEVIHVDEGSRTASNYYLPEDVDWDSIYDAVRAITGTS